MSDSLIREVDEEVRRDKMIERARRYGPWVLAGGVLAVLIMVGRVYWIDQQNAGREADSVAFQTAVDLMEQGEFAEAAAIFGEITVGSDEGFGALAGL